MTPMLTGYRVLDITQFVAGPTCTRIMAELGAEVIKVELAPSGDHGRRSGLRARGDGDEDCSQSTYFAQHNHSKKSLALDLKDPRGQDLVKRMVPKIDVVVENFAPGAIARMGLDYDTLKAINPRLVMCSISMAGQSGPLSGQPGFDYMASAYAGITSVIGEPDRGPVQVPIAMGDSATGVAAAMAVGFALLHRERTGEGQYIDCSLLDTYVQMHEDLIPRVGLRGAKAMQARPGSQHPNGGPTGVFHAGDGQYVQIMIMPYQWERIVAAMDMPELTEDPRFKTRYDRRENRFQLKEIIEAWMAGLGGRDAVIEALNRERVPVAPVLELADVIDHPHLRERGTIRDLDDPHIGRFPVPGRPPAFSRWTYETALSAPLLGEHNAAVLEGLLGLSAEEVAALHDDDILVADRRVGAEGDG
ncbi:MAG: CoA transferase [Magnetovibrio sp.]|nr:CoA transferase [Magnetovibrio sp.]